MYFCFQKYVLYRYPTVNPTINPIANATNDPTNEPTNDPTNDVTNDVTNDPTNEPTADPTLIIEKNNANNRLVLESILFVLILLLH